jgi:hypothetical protein
MSKSALQLVLVLAVCLVAYSPAVPVTTHFSAADLSPVAMRAEVEDSATEGVSTNPSTNKQDQGGKPFQGKAVDKGRRLWEALKPRWLELPLRGASTRETPIGDCGRGFTLPLKAA